MTPATFRLVAQCPNPLRHHVPRILIRYNTFYRFSATSKLNPDSKSYITMKLIIGKSVLFWPRSQIWVHNVSSITSYHYAHLQHEESSDCWTGLSVVKNSSLFLTIHLQIIQFLQFYACRICTRKLPEFIHTKVKILVPVA
jgi:hypothetical protein